MYLHGDFSRLSRPGADTCGLGDPIHRTAGIETACQGGSGVETVALVEVGAGAATRIDLRFKHGHVQPSACQYRRGGQTAHTRTDHNYPPHLLHPFLCLGSYALQGSALPAVFDDGQVALDQNLADF